MKLLLYIKNPENCIAIRGNHECIDRPITKDWALREAKVKFFKTLDGKAEQEALSFFSLLEKLPVAAFVGSKDHTKQSGHFLISHAAPNLGVNPKNLLESLKSTPDDNILYCAIDQVSYNRHLSDNFHSQAIINNLKFKKNNPNIEQYLNVNRQSEPRDLSFCRDQLVNQDPELPFEYFHNIKVLAWGLPLIKAIMKDWKIFCMIRGHQHAHVLDCQRDSSLLIPMIELQKAEGASLSWKENSPGEKELLQHDVVTVQVGPDSIYG